MQNLTQPQLLLKPFAQDGTKNTIPLNNTDATNPQKADLTNGFPAITSLEPDDGGLPPERADFNGLGYLTTLYDYFYQAGGTFTFNATISSAIGGYPLGARLWHTQSNGDTEVLRSTIPNNTHNFNSNDRTGWVKDTPTMTDVNDLGNKVSAIEGKIPGSASTSNKLATASDLQNIITTLYPVGSIYIGTQNTCPLTALIHGSTWVLVAQNSALWGGNGSNGNTTIGAGLPNITGKVGFIQQEGSPTVREPTGAFSSDGQSTTSYNAGDGYGTSYLDYIKFDASSSSSIYGNSETVQPPAYRVNVWRRTA